MQRSDAETASVSIVFLALVLFDAPQCQGAQDHFHNHKEQENEQDQIEVADGIAEDFFNFPLA